MFKCKVCAEKELRISELKDQIKYFKSLLNPPPRVTQYELESDNILNGAGGEEVIMPKPASEEAQEQEDSKLYDIQMEHDRILAGNY